MTRPPILYSFRRCPYAMRARMALWVARITVELREVKLADKPPELAEASPKATVPVLVLDDGTVIDESIAIMHWALECNDPKGWLAGDDAPSVPGLIARNDGPFKHHLDRYKYPTRYPDEAHGDEETFRLDHRNAGLAILTDLDSRLGSSAHLCGETPTLADIALFPFIRQFANTDRDWFDAQGLPHVQEWLERHLASDLFRAIMPKFAPWKAGDEPILFGP
ncbi:glutathione S-transferase [Erythrobacter sp. JK5]|uniref:glutathione S-transferase n=1 Tax=Erythrobacter sp. JK5 TaxID=2829500 RepID=UPI001BAD6CCE|nr:glutathione S-transferase [Erythrobacter sp. JK5]QUL38338.1 glutathione S-transferase [Erythrobacter sp. JK5]